MARLYANGHDLKDPMLSPVYGDMHGFPPTLTTGTRDLCSATPSASIGSSVKPVSSRSCMSTKDSHTRNTCGTAMRRKPKKRLKKLRGFLIGISGSNLGAFRVSGGDGGHGTGIDRDRRHGLDFCVFRTRLTHPSEQRSASPR